MGRARIIPFPFNDMRMAKPHWFSYTSGRYVLSRICHCQCLFTKCKDSTYTVISDGVETSYKVWVVTMHTLPLADLLRSIWKLAESNP